MISIYRIISRKYLSLYISPLFIAILCFFCPYSSAEKDVYGSIDIEQYVTGRFDPSQNKAFISLKEAGVPCDEKQHFLRKDAAAALKEMLERFHRENPGVGIFVRSSTRTFQDQRKIWNDKWDGTVLVNGVNLRKSIADPGKRAREILRYSSMPGTSRHHWGTDVDFNSLANSYFGKGKGKVIFDWLCAHGAEYGYYRPYTAGRVSGYNEEKWHWSYCPDAKIFLADWNNLLGGKASSDAGIQFHGARDAWPLAALYVNSINGDCR